VNGGLIDERQRDRLQLAAAWSRIVLALIAIFFLPLLYPGLDRVRGIFVAYIGIAMVGQVLIYKSIGGMWRAVVGGVIDVALLTLIVHRVGSIANMMVSIYFFAAILNTLVVGRRVGVSLAVVGAASYGAVVLCETLGWLPYGPDAPAWAQTVAPSAAEAAVAVSLLSVLLVSSAAVVGVLVSQIRQRESELVAANHKLAELSLRDPLTQLFNRRHLMARLEGELARARRGRPLAVVMIDLDRFKRVNDERGHQQGDEVLRDIANALGAATREMDVPGRYGGDEFVVLLPETDRAKAQVAAERLCAAVREVGMRFDAEEPVTASIGIASARYDDEARALIQRADQHAYRAKQGGGDRVVMEEPPAESGEHDAQAEARVTPLPLAEPLRAKKRRKTS
jgi:diguanylate cyclase (GGDEF)-like protein